MKKKRMHDLPGYSRVLSQLDCLYAAGDLQEQAKLYYREKLALLGKLFLAGLTLSLALLVGSVTDGSLEDGYFLSRQKQAFQKELELQVEGEEARTVEIQVEPRELTAEECQALLEDTMAGLDTCILGDNASLDEVRSDLQLLTEVENTLVCIRWELDSYELMNMDGSLRRERLAEREGTQGEDFAESGVLVTLTAHLTCQEEAAVYQCVARVLPPLLNKEETFLQELEKELAKSQESSRASHRKALPEKVQGKTLVWKEKIPLTSLLVFLVTVVCLPLVYIAKDRDLRQQIRDREEQMSRDYARIVSRLVLLMGAGTTIRNAWEQLVRDYKKGLEQGKGMPRYAYEEMALALREMQNGVAEALAYEHFGLRCRVPCYLKLSALLEQNLKKGNRGLTTLLKIQVQEAFEQRKELARRKGEEAATKLLLPMMLLLLVVLLLILAPALMSMQM